MAVNVEELRKRVICFKKGSVCERKRIYDYLIGVGEKVVGSGVMLLGVLVDRYFGYSFGAWREITLGIAPEYIISEDDFIAAYICSDNKEQTLNKEPKDIPEYVSEKWRTTASDRVIREDSFRELFIARMRKEKISVKDTTIDQRSRLKYFLESTGETIWASSKFPNSCSTNTVLMFSDDCWCCTIRDSTITIDNFIGLYRLLLSDIQYHSDTSFFKSDVPENKLQGLDTQLIKYHLNTGMVSKEVVDYGDVLYSAIEDFENIYSVYWAVTDSDYLRFTVAGNDFSGEDVKRIEEKLNPLIGGTGAVIGVIPYPNIKDLIPCYFYHGERY